MVSYLETETKVIVPRVDSLLLCRSLPLRCWSRSSWPLIGWVHGLGRLLDYLVRGQQRHPGGRPRHLVFQALLLQVRSAEQLAMLAGPFGPGPRF